MLSNLTIKYASCIPKNFLKNSLHCSKYILQKQLSLLDTEKKFD